VDPEAPIVAADTVVVLDGRILRPRDAEEAREMFRALRDRTHEVITAVALLPRGERGAGPAAAHAGDDARLRRRRGRGRDLQETFRQAGAYGIRTGSSGR
jgi:septum formation protein